MSLRNFWLEAESSSSKSKLHASTRSKSDSMRVSLKQQAEGNSVKVLDVSCIPDEDGETLYTYINVVEIEKEYPELVQIERTNTGFKIITRRKGK